MNCTQRNGVITGYRIRYFVSEEPQPIFLNVTSDSNATVTGLDEHLIHYISVAAINNIGIGPYSQEFSFYTSW